MSFYTFMSQNRKKVCWIYGFEIDYDIIERIDKHMTFFTSNYGYDGFASDEVTERVTDFLRRDYDCIAPMMGWDPDSPMKERTYVLVVHAHSTPEYYKDRVKVMRRIARVKSELMPDVKAKAKWHFSCDAGVFKGDVDWNSRPRPFFGRLKPRSDTKNS